MSNDGTLDAAAIGEHRAGQVCPIFGIKRKGLRIQFVSIDNQDSLVGDNIVLGSPAGQRPGGIFAFGGDAAGHEGKRPTFLLAAKREEPSALKFALIM